jgi:hypothetical protein
LIDSTFLLLIAAAIALDVIYIVVRRRAKRAGPASPPSATTRSAPSRRPLSLDVGLFIAAALVFLITRLIALDRWPIYFFTDEAINAVRAAEFLSNGLRDGHGVFLPTYFQNEQYISLSTSVYAQVIPTALFGFSVFVTRAVVVLITLSGTLAVGLILRDMFKLRFWWIGPLLLSITPAWFLHTRTAFEHPLWVAFYAWFLYFYLRYRTGQPRHLITTIIFGALSFYSYNGGQLGVVLTSLLLLIVDARYHWRTLRASPKLLIAAAGTVIIAALPYLRFYLQHTDETVQHLRLLDSYWTQPLPLSEKLGRLIQEYWNGLRPDYWFAPDNGRDLIRHQMKGYAQLPIFTLPFFVLGLVLTLKRFRLPSSRVVLIALLVAPVGGVLVAANILRDLVFVIPATLLTSIGLIAVLEWLTERFRLTRRTAAEARSPGASPAQRAGYDGAYRAVALSSFAIITIINGVMLYDATVNGPTWYDNYGLTGLQYGGQAVFEEAQNYLDTHPGAEVWIAPTWINGPDAIKQFFAPADPRIKYFDLDAVLHQPYTIDSLLMVLTHDDYQRAIDSGIFTTMAIERTLPYPDHTPGFYFVRLAYSPQAAAIWAAEREARSRLVADTAVIAGQTVTVTHSPIDVGPIQNIFDGDPQTLIRTADVNPAVIEIEFSPPRTLSGVRVSTGSMEVALTAEVSIGGDTRPGRYSGTFTELPADPTVELDFDQPYAITRLRLEIKDPRATDRANIHVREIEFK